MRPPRGLTAKHPRQTTLGAGKEQHHAYRNGEQCHAKRAERRLLSSPKGLNGVDRDEGGEQE
jgi:hypothetical protein